MDIHIINYVDFIPKLQSENIYVLCDMVLENLGLPILFTSNVPIQTSINKETKCNINIFSKAQYVYLDKKVESKMYLFSGRGIGDDIPCNLWELQREIQNYLKCHFGLSLFVSKCRELKEGGSIIYNEYYKHLGQI